MLNNSPASGMVYASLVIIVGVEEDINFTLVSHDPLSLVGGHTVGTFVAQRDDLLHKQSMNIAVQKEAGAGQTPVDPPPELTASVKELSPSVVG